MRDQRRSVRRPARVAGSRVATNGAFDITQGPVVRLWREARKTGRLPDPAALKEAASRSGFRKLHLDDERRTVTLEIAGMALDVGAIGKGYAASEALEVLSARGVRQRDGGSERRPCVQRRAPGAARVANPRARRSTLQSRTCPTSWS